MNIILQAAYETERKILSLEFLNFEFYMFDYSGSQIQNKWHPVLAQNGKRHLTLKYGTVPYFKE